MYKIREWALEWFGFIINSDLSYRVKGDRILACPKCGGILLDREGTWWSCSGSLSDDAYSEIKQARILGRARCGFEGPISAFLPGITRNKLEKILGGDDYKEWLEWIRDKDYKK